MASTAKKAAAVAYARAMLELATAQGQAEALGEELAQLRELIESRPTFAMFLSDPGIGQEQRLAAIGRIFRGRVMPLVWNLLGVLCRKDRLDLLADIARAYQEMLDRQLGKVAVDVMVPQRLEESMLEEVRRGVSSALGKQAVVRQREDPSLIGGLVLRVEDRMIDGSVRAQLERIRRRMMAAAPR